jgi:hypothetical protein
MEAYPVCALLKKREIVDRNTRRTRPISAWLASPARRKASACCVGVRIGRRPSSRPFDTHLGLLPPSFAPTGNSFVSKFASFYEIEKGRMLRGRAISDLLKVALQLKLMPEL